LDCDRRQRRGAALGAAGLGTASIRGPDDGNPRHHPTVQKDRSILAGQHDGVQVAADPHLSVWQPQVP
jgi:hypothetical protein